MRHSHHIGALYAALVTGICSVGHIWAEGVNRTTRSIHVVGNGHKASVTFLFVAIAMMFLLIHSVAGAATAGVGPARAPRDATTGKYEINVCFWNTTTTPTLMQAVLEASLMQTASDVLAKTWEAFSGIDFHFRYNCQAVIDAQAAQNALKNWITIKLVASHNPGGGTQPGYGARLGDDPQVQVLIEYEKDPTSARYLENFKSVVVHEVGHALSLIHEHARSDWPGRSLGMWTNTGCTSNVTNPAPNTNRDAWNCDHHDTYAGIFNDPFGSPLICCVGNNVVDCSTPGAIGGNIYHTVDSGFHAVPVDPASIMAPWKCDPDRRAHTPPHSDKPDYWALSYLDLLGIEIIYPFSFVRSIRGRNGFVVQNGIVVRNDDTLLTDWHFRGALTSVYKTTPEWAYSGKSKTANSLNVSSVGSSGIHNVSVKFEDMFSDNRTHDRVHSGTTQIVINNALHTALIMVGFAN